MANNDVDVTFTSHLGEFNTEFDAAVKKALEEMGIEAEAHAKEIITEKGAVDTGRLRNSITWAVGGEKANASGYSGTAPKKDEPCVYIGTNVEYAPYIEFGSSRSKKGERPFIRPAVEDFADQYKEIAERNLGEIK
ncbi:MAG: HK97 gp10 family phage protein [Ruminococcaceae bacterium]|nr:HK97 gp10 family phage protein [Oscillospiraceae bacterium]